MSWRTYGGRGRDGDDLPGEDLVRVGDLRVRGDDVRQVHPEPFGDLGEGVTRTDDIGGSRRRGAPRNGDDLPGEDLVRVGDLRVRGDDVRQAHPEPFGDLGEGVTRTDDIGGSRRRGAPRNGDDLPGEDLVRVGDLRVRGDDARQAHPEPFGDLGEGVTRTDDIGGSRRRGAPRNRDDLPGEDLVRVGDLRVRGDDARQAHPEPFGDLGERVTRTDDVPCHDVPP